MLIYFCKEQRKFKVSSPWRRFGSAYAEFEEKVVRRDSGENVRPFTDLRMPSLPSWLFLSASENCCPWLPECKRKGESEEGPSRATWRCLARKKNSVAGGTIISAFLPVQAATSLENAIRTTVPTQAYELFPLSQIALRRNHHPNHVSMSN